LEDFSQTIFAYPLTAWLLLIWSFLWKGWALWKAATKRQLIWFMVLLIFNTLGLLEIAYIFYLNKWDIDKGRLLAVLEKRFSRAKK
jgi:hypothetical protein